MVSMASPHIIEISPEGVRGAAGALSTVAIGICSVLSSGISWGTFREFIPLRLSLRPVLSKHSGRGFLTL